MASEGDSSRIYHDIGVGHIDTEMSAPMPEGNSLGSIEGNPRPRRYNPPLNSSSNHTLQSPANPSNIHASPSAIEIHRNKDPESPTSLGRGKVNYGLQVDHPFPPLPLSSSPYPEDRALEQQRSADDNARVDSNRRPASASAIDWIVPIEALKEAREGRTRMTVAERLQPTILVAMEQKEKYAYKAKVTGITLNTVIGLQVVLGSLTTGLSALAASGGKSVAIPTTILGALATIVASYLARARGSNEPELSITRVKDLEQFIRDCESFKMDNGHISTHELDQEIDSRRSRFEELLGNSNG